MRFTQRLCADRDGDALRGDCRRRGLDRADRSSGTPAAPASYPLSGRSRSANAQRQPRPRLRLNDGHRGRGPLLSHKRHHRRLKLAPPSREGLPQCGGIGKEMTAEQPSRCQRRANCGHPQRSEGSLRDLVSLDVPVLADGRRRSRPSSRLIRCPSGRGSPGPAGHAANAALQLNPERDASNCSSQSRGWGIGTDP